MSESKQYRGYTVTETIHGDVVALEQRPMLKFDEGKAYVELSLLDGFGVDCAGVAAVVAGENFGELVIRGELCDLITDYIDRRTWCHNPLTLDAKQRPGLVALRDWLQEMVGRIDAVRFVEKLVSLDQLDLTVRTRKVLAEFGITTPELLLQTPPAVLVRLPSLGRKSCAEIQEKLKPFGFDMEFPEGDEQ